MLSPKLLRKRQIRVFLSSTFEDLQVERDYLMKHVLRRLEMKAQKHNVVFTIVDLRWGIPENDATAGRVIQTCLDEVTFSKPYFIGIIGNRYGWCPTKADLIANESLLEKYPFLKDHQDGSMSLTEMEIQYGVLSNNSKVHACFFFKQMEATAINKQASQLKEKIRADGRYPITEFRSSNELGDTIVRFFETILEKEYPVLEKDNDWDTWDRISILTEHYYPSRRDQLAITRFVNSNEKRVLLLFGDPGTGKSATIAYWLKRNLTKDGRSLPDGRRVVFVKEGETVREWAHYQAKYGPCLIVIDKNEGERCFREYTPPPIKVKVICTKSKDDIDYESKREFDEAGHDDEMDSSFVTYWYIRGLSVKQRRQLIRAHLGRFRKRLSDDMEESIVSDCKTVKPAVLITMLEELVFSAIYKDLQNKVQLLCNLPQNKLFMHIVDRLVREYDSIGALSLIAAEDKCGVSEKELMQMLEYSQTEWSGIYSAIRPFLRIDSKGKLYIRFPMLRDAVMRHTASFRFLRDYDLHHNNEAGEHPDHIYAYWSRFTDSYVSVEFEDGNYNRHIGRGYLDAVDSPDADWETLRDIGLYLIEIGHSEPYKYAESLYSLQKRLLSPDDERILFSLELWAEFDPQESIKEITEFVNERGPFEWRLDWLFFCANSAEDNHWFMDRIEELALLAFCPKSLPMAGWYNKLASLTDYEEAFTHYCFAALGIVSNLGLGGTEEEKETRRLLKTELSDQYSDVCRCFTDTLEDAFKAEHWEVALECARFLLCTKTQKSFDTICVYRAMAGHCLWMLGDYAAARREQLRVIQDIGFFPSPSGVFSHYAMEYILETEATRYPSQEDKRSLERWRKTVGCRHADPNPLWMGDCIYYLKEEPLDKAILEFKKAIKDYGDSIAVRCGYPYWRIGDCLVCKEEFREAIPWYQNALTLFWENDGTVSLYAEYICKQIAQCYHHLGDNQMSQRYEELASHYFLQHSPQKYSRFREEKIVLQDSRFMLKSEGIKKIVVAPDSFKECMSAKKVAFHLARSLGEIRPDVEVITMPLADGGEGTLEALSGPLNARIESVKVHDPLGREVHALMGIADDTAIIEVAQACGHRLLAPQERNPLVASSRGVGELIMAAYDKGCRHLIVALEDCVTCDGGVGMMSVPGIKHVLESCTVELLGDDLTWFVGKTGVARRLASQNGASPEDVEILENRMIELVAKMLTETGVCVTFMKGAGAAGGIAGALFAYAKASLHAGTERIMELCGFADAVKDAQLIITGEGKSDLESLIFGENVPSTVARHAAGVPVALLSGWVEQEESLLEEGFCRVIEVYPHSLPLEKALEPATAALYLREAVRNLMQE